LGTFGFPSTNLGFEDGDAIPHLSFGESNVHCGTQMELELIARARHAGKGCGGHKFPALVIEDVTGEDVREKMLFQERVNNGREQLITAALSSYLVLRIRPHCTVYPPSTASA
jgi:hypothetical protein